MFYKLDLQRWRTIASFAVDMVDSSVNQSYPDVSNISQSDQTEGILPKALRRFERLPISGFFFINIAALLLNVLDVLIQTRFYISLFLDTIYSDDLTESHRCTTLLATVIPISQL